MSAAPDPSFTAPILPPGEMAARLEDAVRRVRGVAHRTPVATSRTLDERTGATVLLKCENLQRMGAFKFRGAYNTISRLAPEALARGVIAYSSGNHAQAVALVARLLGAPAVIVMPSFAPRPKLEATRGYGAEVVFHDRLGEEREALAARLAAERGLTASLGSEVQAAIDAGKRQVRLASGANLPYDRLIVSPGIESGAEFMYEGVKGMTAADADVIPHAWKAGPQTVLLRRQLEAMPDGGIVVLSVPLAPYRCPPGPYERTCQIAHYLKTRKPKSKVIVLDANPQVTSKGPLFTRVWKEDYAGIVEYRPNMAINEVDVRGRTFVSGFGDRIKGDVLNFIPPQRAANIARDAGLITANNRWCEVDWVTMESIKVPGVHVLGDATLSAPLMPKSGHMANQHGKAAAAAVVEILNGRTPVPPMMANTCYSFIDDKNAIHVASVHQWVAAKKTMEVVAGASGVTSQDRGTWGFVGQYAWGWAQTVWADMLA